MAAIRIRLGARSYTIQIAAGVLPAVSTWLAQHAAGAPLAVITDETVAGLYLDEFLAGLHQQPAAVICLPPGEASKSLDSAAEAFDTLARVRMARNGVMLALGGGVMTDLAGFVAGIWMRGIRLVSIPTTVEAALDASVGGKTAINLPAGKNLVGVIHQPQAVFIDPLFFRTLPPRDLRAGLAESVKHGVLRDPGLLEWQDLHSGELLAVAENAWIALLARNCRIKADIVERDEYEHGLRAILNYGHTIGHALEHVCGYTLRHGECVALGILVENELAVRRGWLKRERADSIRGHLERLELPTRLTQPVLAEAIHAATRLDKKSRGGEPDYVLIRDLGITVRAGNISLEEVRQALRAILPT